VKKLSPNPHKPERRASSNTSYKHGLHKHIAERTAANIIDTSVAYFQALFNILSTFILFNANFTTVELQGIVKKVTISNYSRDKLLFRHGQATYSCGYWVPAR